MKTGKSDYHQRGMKARIEMTYNIEITETATTMTTDNNKSLQSRGGYVVVMWWLCGGCGGSEIKDITAF